MHIRTRLIGIMVITAVTVLGASGCGSSHKTANAASPKAPPITSVADGVHELPTGANPCPYTVQNNGTCLASISNVTDKVSGNTVTVGYTITNLTGEVINATTEDAEAFTDGSLKTKVGQGFLLNVSIPLGVSTATIVLQPVASFTTVVGNFHTIAGSLFGPPNPADNGQWGPGRSQYATQDV